MHKNRKKTRYYAKIIIVISITLFLYGILSSVFHSIKIIDPIKDVEHLDDDPIISITTIDGSQIVPGNTIKEDTNEEKPSSNKTQSKPQNNSQNNIQNNGNQTIENNTPRPQSPEVQPIDEQNNSIRNSIQNSFGVNIKYGNETAGYKVAGLDTVPIDDSNTINNQLNQLRDTLSRYPKGLFQEIKNGGIPLTIILISQYSELSVTGVTDSSYSYAVISIAAIHPFAESFYHESYHYIERYIFKKGQNFNNWDSLNPKTFQGWGVVDGNLSYANTFSPDAPFVNNYAQTAPTEDRASTFEYMMADSKASCLNQGTYVWNKANRMAVTMETVLNSVSPYTVERWEQYL